MHRSLALALTFVVIIACDSSSPSGDDGAAGGTQGTGTATSMGGGPSESTASADGGDSDGGSDASADEGTAGGTNPGTTGPDGPSCGNGQLDGDEVCDGEAGLDDTTCVSLGYVAGTVACTDDCSALDDSGCSESAICGDGELSVGEACEADLSTPDTCGSVGEGSGDLACIDCQWSVSSCCAATCTQGCDSACGADPNDLTGTWTIHFINNGWQGPDPTMIMELVQEGSVLSGSFTTDAWYLGDHEFDGGERNGNDVYMHVPITQLANGMIMEGTVCGACSMFGVTDPQGGLNSDWVATRP